MRKIRMFLLLLALSLALCVSAGATACTGLRMNATAERDGTLDCQLTLTCSFDVSQQSFEVKLPVGARNITVYNYRSETEAETVTLLADSVFSGSVTFRVDYTLPQAFRAMEDGGQLLCAELVPGTLGVTVQYVEFSLTLPETYKNEPRFLVGAAQTDQTVFTLDATKVAGSLSQTIAAGEGLTLQLELPEDYFEVQENTLSGLFAGWRLLIVALIVLLVVYWYLFFFRHSRLPHTGRRTMPPDGISAGELQTLLTGRAADPAALLAGWAGLGYVQLVQRSGVLYVRMLMGMGSERSALECDLFARLFREADAVRVDTNFYRECAAHTTARMRAHWVRRLFDRKSGLPTLLLALSVMISTLLCLSAFTGRGTVWALLSVPAGALLSVAFQQGMLNLLRHGNRLMCGVGLAAGAAMLLCMAIFGGATILLALVLLTLTALAVCHGGRRTAFGMEKLEQTLSFRRHLLDADPQELRTLVRQDGQYFYRMLPFAMALGVERSFAARFGNLKLEPCAYLAEAPACTAGQFCALFAPMAASLRAGKTK